MTPSSNYDPLFLLEILDGMANMTGPWGTMKGFIVVAVLPRKSAPPPIVMTFHYEAPFASLGAGKPAPRKSAPHCYDPPPFIVT